MVAVVGRPPQRPALHAGGADAGEHELHGARGAEGAMREVAVVEAGDGEHAQHVQRRRRPRAPVRDTPTQNTARQARCIAMKGAARSQSMRSDASPVEFLRRRLVSNQRRNATASRARAGVLRGWAGCSSDMRISSCEIHGTIRDPDADRDAVARTRQVRCWIAPLAMTGPVGAPCGCPPAGSSVIASTEPATRAARTSCGTVTVCDFSMDTSAQ